MARNQKQDGKVETEVEVETQVETQVEVKPKGMVVTVINVFSPMPHLLKNVTIDGPTEFECMDSFLQSQIDAGKLRLV